MITAYVDASLLSIPNLAGEDSTEFEDILTRIVEWSRLATNCSSLALLKASSLEAVLSNLNSFPVRPAIQEVLSFYDLEYVFDSNTVARAYNNILDRALPSLDALGFEIAAVGQATVSPDVLNGLAPAALVEQAASTLAQCTFAQVRLQSPLHFVASPFPQAGPMSVLGEYQDATLLELREPLSPQNVESVKGVAFLLDGLEHLPLAIDPLTAWHCARDLSDIHLAIALRAKEIIEHSSGPIKLSEVPTFSIGPQFLKSLGDFQAFGDGEYAGPTLETCARLVSGSPKNVVGPFGKPIQASRSKDGALGWRTHVTKKGIGLRLMFWRVTSSVELANIGSKFELKIEYGSPAEAQSCSY